MLVKKRALFTIIFLLTLSVAAWADTIRSKPLKVAALLAPSGKGDKSYNQMALDGVAEARKNGSINVKEMLPAKVDDYPVALQRLSKENYDLIVCIGYLYTDAIKSVAPKFPKTRYVIIDGEVNGINNVRSITFKPQEGSFLVGVAAGLVSKGNNIGFIAGMDIPIMHNFACGFRDGVTYASKIRNTTISVTEKYIGNTPDSFSNPARGRDLATLMYKTGINVIYHAAGSSGNGVIQAARENNKLVIGVDADQSYLAPNNVLTSMRKRIDLAVGGAIDDIRKDNFSGGLKTMTVANGGVDYVRSKLAPNVVWDEIENAKRKLIAGEITICR